MNDCISRASLIEHLDNVCYNPDTPWGIAQKAYINCFKAFINREPSVTPTEQSGDPESEKYKLAKRIKEDLVAYISNMHDEHGDVLIEIANDFRNYAAMNGDMEAVR